MVDQKNILADKFNNSSSVAYLAYLANIFESINILNKELKGKNINIISAREIVSVFGLKLQYWRQKVEQKKIALFLEDCENITFADIKDTIVRHLIKLRKQFSDYFPDLDTRTVRWTVDPFKCEIALIPEEPSGLAEAILELRSNIEARIQLESKPNLSSFWMSKAAKAFIIAHEEVVKKLLPFRTTYLCEQGFSTLMNIKTKNRNPLNAEDCIQIALTSKSPNF
ncbi:protein ZBED8-like [Stegodyphus dumicola]|uniref:protein ZBED8-like n=1 Tax=Stegodyphus dumicola TaxID=202533 RepID=UPI0015B1A00A|nr:protein ZBED8-like [Stegodyphus dumicola]